MRFAARKRREPHFLFDWKGPLMAVYVDDLVEYPGKGRWCHMVSSDLEELHALAEKIGLRREWFQSRSRHPHYDLMAFTRALAVQHGAIQVTRRELVQILKRGEQSV